MQRILLNLTNHCSKNQFHYNNDLPAIGNKNYALQKPFKTDFLTQEAATRNCDRYLSFELSVPRHPISHCNIFFWVQLFATIILSWNLLKCILWYLLELSDPFFKNENSVLSILVEKNWTKNGFLSLGNGVFFQRRKIQFFKIKLDYRNNFLYFM